MIRCWTVLRAIGRAVAAPVRRLHRIRKTSGFFARPRRKIRPPQPMAPAVVPEIVCADVGGGAGGNSAGSFFGVPGPLAAGILGGIGALGAAFVAGIAALNGEFGSVFSPAPQQLQLMGSGPSALATGPGSPGIAGGAAPSAAVSTPPASIPGQTVPEPSSLALFAAGLAGLALARWWRRRRR